MRRLLGAALLCAAAPAVFGQEAKANAEPNTSVTSLLTVRRIYVGQFIGGAQAEAMRELIIASLNSTKLFVLTENEARADAVLKGTANDTTYTDSFDHYEGMSVKDPTVRTGTIIAGGGQITENDSHHERERKHEAYATVRLCNRDGDVLWSTTQESLGAKFKGASSDVASKVARQIELDFDRQKRTEAPSAAITAPAAAQK